MLEASTDLDHDLSTFLVLVGSRLDLTRPQPCAMEGPDAGLFWRKDGHRDLLAPGHRYSLADLFPWGLDHVT